MKILHVNMVLSGGGLEQYLFQTFEELNKKDYKNIYLYGEDIGIDSSLPKAKTFFIQYVTHQHCKNLNAKLKMVQDILDKENPDLVLIHQVLNSYLIHLLTRQKPSIRFVHGFKLICPDGRKTLKTNGKICPFPLSYLCQARAYLFKCMPRNPLIGLPLIHSCQRIVKIHQARSQIVVSSEFMKKILLYNGFQEKLINVIPLFTHLPDLETQSVSNNDSFILSLGRLAPEKGMDFLIRAFSAIKGTVRLVILGNGPAMEDLKILAKGLGISERVSFPGWVSHNEIEAFFRKCKLVVVPSISPESFGLVGIEAMSYQKPVVAFNSGGISEWLKDGKTGFMISPRNENELAEKVNFLLERPDVAKQMGKEGRIIAEHRFAPEIHISSLIAFFKKTINTHYHRRRVISY